jgi:hypothetical protein
MFRAAIMAKNPMIPFGKRLRNYGTSPLLMGKKKRTQWAMASSSQTVTVEGT